MLEVIRRWGVEKKWMFAIVMGTVTVAFVGGMGMLGMSGPTGIYAAKVNGDEILVTEFERAYKNTYQRYQQMIGEEWNDEMAEQFGLKRQVLMQMVDQRLWIDRAEELGLAVSDAEVREALMEIGAFQINGRFNPAQYKQALKRIRTSAEAFEASVRTDLLASKARTFAVAAAGVSHADMTLFATPAEDDAKLSAEERAEQDRTRMQGLNNRKQNQVMSSVVAHLRQTADLELFPENVGI
ncbi:MAG: SurA N-terminal domain-containing protein [Nitrospirota bacterium]|nr:SurA N-terminal domain-containing protein [Nitrospirota bacterium]